VKTSTDSERAGAFLKLTTSCNCSTIPNWRSVGFSQTNKKKKKMLEREKELRNRGQNNKIFAGEIDGRECTLYYSLHLLLINNF
jgi:hypothetical protein